VNGQGDSEHSAKQAGGSMTLWSRVRSWLKINLEGRTATGRVPGAARVFFVDAFAPILGT